MSLSKICFILCLAFIAGIFISSIIYFSQLVILGVLILGCFFVFFSVFLRDARMIIIGFCLLFLILGVWRYQTVELSVSNNELLIFNDANQEVVVRGVVIAEPDKRDERTRIIVEPKQIQFYELLNSKESEITFEKINNGKILITARKYPEYQYGDELKIIGKLKTPKEFEDFNYRGYLAKDEIYSVMYTPKIILLKKDQGNIFYAKILEFKNKLRNSIYENISPPQSAILGAMIFGDKNEISDKWKEKLNIAGVRHITCISGVHIVILSGILMSIGIGLGLWRGQAFYFTIILLAFFIIMVGAPPSAIRAGIMGGLFLFAQKIGRSAVSDRALVFAAVLMLVDNPLLLKFDIGFQLSFLAVFGIICWMPIFQDYMKIIPIRFIRDILAMSFAAQIFTLPILIYNFGYISLVSPIVNLLIVPLLPFVLGFGFLFSLIGIFSSFLAWILSWFCWMMLSYIVIIVNLFSNTIYSSLNLEISLIWLFVSYLILGCVTYYIKQKRKLRFLNY